MHQTRSRANPGGIDVLEVLGAEVQPFRARKPAWFKVPAPGGPKYRELDRLIKDEGLHTVCQEAACPNIGECWERGTATFMILGDTCTRRCGFCNVKTGKPTWNDPLEPRARRPLGRAHGPAPRGHHQRRPRRPARLRRRRLRAATIRSDPPPGAGLQGRGPHARLPRRGDAAGQGHRRAPRRLQPQRRGRRRACTRSPAAARRWERSCRVLRNAKEMGGDEVVTKSGLMVGLGETLRGDRRRARPAARAAASRSSPSASTCARPSATCRSCATGTRTSSPRWRPPAYALGFDHIAAGPLVRSSYHADQHVPQDQPGVGPVAPRPPPRASSAAPVFPLKDNIPTRALPGRHGGADRAQRARVLLLAAGRGRARGPEQPATTSCNLVDYGAIPCEITDRRQCCPTRPSRGSCRRTHVAAADVLTLLHRRCSCTAACCTSAATCCSCGSSATTSRTAMGPVRFVVFYLLGGLAALAVQVARRPGLGGADHRRLGRDRRRARRLPRCSSRGRGC